MNKKAIGYWHRIGKWEGPVFDGSNTSSWEKNCMHWIFKCSLCIKFDKKHYFCSLFLGLKLCWNWQIEDEASKKKTSCDWLFAFLNIFGTEWNDFPYHLFYSYLGLILPLRAEKLVIWQYQSKMSQIRQKCPGGLGKHFCHICNNSRCIHFRIVHFSTLNSTFSTLNNIFSWLKSIFSSLNFLVLWIVLRIVL